MDDAAFELAYLERPLERPLTWAGGLVLVATLLPVRLDAGGPLWSWQLAWVPSGLAVLTLELLAGVTFILLARTQRVSKLTKGVVALGLVALTTALLLEDPDCRAALLPFVPSTLAQGGLALITALGAAGAALRFRHGPRDAARSRAVVLACSLVAWTSLLALYAWPHPIGTVTETVWTALESALTTRAGIPVRLGFLLIALMSLLPAILVLRAQRITWREPRAHLGAASWVAIVFPAMLLALGVKAAATFGSDLVALIALRSAALILAALLVAIYGGTAVLSQLFDHRLDLPVRPSTLLRDELVYDLLDPARQAAARSRLDAVRPALRRMVEARVHSLRFAIGEAAPRLDGDAVNLACRLALAGVPDDELAALDEDALASRLRSAPRPRAPWVARWLGYGRRAEVLAVVLVAVLAMGWSVVRDRLAPSSPPWQIEPAPAWATELYRTAIPNIAIAAQFAQDGAGDAARLHAVTEHAVRESAPLSELAEAIAELGSLAAWPGRHRRGIERAGERINRAARQAGLPLYLDVNVRGTRRGRFETDWLFFVKTYRIVRARTAEDGRGRYGALWLERLDNTNVVERRLGWKKYRQRYGMVVLDVLRRHWQDTLRPALSHPSHTQGSYARFSGAIEADLVVSMAAAGYPRDLLSGALRCAREGDRGGECRVAEIEAESAVVEALARKVEVHELQHVYDAEDLPIPDALRLRMQGYGDDAIRSAAAELSAYLSEMAHSEQPRLALVHLVVLAAVKPGSAEAFAAKALLYACESDAASLLELEPAVLSARARAAYARLFGRPPAGLVIVDA